MFKADKKVMTVAMFGLIHSYNSCPCLYSPASSGREISPDTRPPTTIRLLSNLTEYYHRPGLLQVVLKTASTVSFTNNLLLLAKAFVNIMICSQFISYFEKIVGQILQRISEAK